MESVLLMVLQFNGPHAGKNRVELIKLMIHKCWLIVYFKFFTSSTIGTSQIGGSSSAVDHQIGILPPDASWIHDFEKPVRENSRLQAMYSTGIKLLEPDLKLWIKFKKYFFYRRILNLQSVSWEMECLMKNSHEFRSLEIPSLETQTIKNVFVRRDLTQYL